MRLVQRIIKQTNDPFMNPPGTSDAFLAVVQANKGIIYKVAQSYCRQPEDKQDLVQEIILQLWRSFQRYSDQYKYSTWTYRIALNTAISFYRKQNRKIKIVNDLSDNISDFISTGSHIEPDENLQLLQQFIAELKELDKALMLLYLEEKSQKEIAEIMGLTPSNVSTRINRIKKILQQKFSTIKP